MARVRTDIELDDDHVRAIMERHGLGTKTAAVALALRHLAGQPMNRDEALAMRGSHAFDPVEDFEAAAMTYRTYRACRQLGVALEPD